MTITGDLVDILLSTKTKDIPEEAQELARQVCLDGIGVMIAGAGEPLGLGRLAFEYTKELGGEPLLQVDAALIVAFKEEGFEVGIETNGTIKVPDAKKLPGTS